MCLPLPEASTAGAPTEPERTRQGMFMPSGYNTKRCLPNPLGMMQNAMSYLLYLNHDASLALDVAGEGSTRSEQFGEQAHWTLVVDAETWT